MFKRTDLLFLPGSVANREICTLNSMDKQCTSIVRAPNYTLADQEVLLELVEEH